MHSASLAAAPAAEPLIYDKLPPELGRDIVCLRAQDHYVEVTTTRGTALVLMRLGDAERDLSCIDGMRVHRSWWVALDQVESLARTESGSWELTASCGQKIPVSRGQREALREALEVRPRPRAAE